MTPGKALQEACHFSTAKVTENKGNHTKNRLFLAATAYFRRYLAAERHPLKIRVTFCGCCRT
jgi:hypothetical protein